jgi:hypothetical protein
MKRTHQKETETDRAGDGVRRTTDKAEGSVVERCAQAGHAMPFTPSIKQLGNRPKQTRIPGTYGRDGLGVRLVVNGVWWFVLCEASGVPRRPRMSSFSWGRTCADVRSTEQQYVALADQAAPAPGRRAAAPGGRMKFALRRAGKQVIDMETAKSAAAKVAVSMKGTIGEVHACTATPWSARRVLYAHCPPHKMCALSYSFTLSLASAAAAQSAGDEGGPHL